MDSKGEVLSTGILLCNPSSISGKGVEKEFNPYDVDEDPTVNEEIVHKRKKRDVDATAQKLFADEAAHSEDSSSQDDICKIHASLLTTCMGEEDETPILQVSDEVCLTESLTAMTGFKGFKPAQQEAIASVLSGVSTLVSIPTGAGKSLCYQLPSFILRCWFNQAIKVKSDLRQNLVLVVSPTISLMYDQLRCLPSSLRGACINSSASFVCVFSNF